MDFEKSLVELEKKIKDLRGVSPECHEKIRREIGELEKKAHGLLRGIYSRLTPWQKVLVARHEDRPKTSQYISQLFDDFLPLAGDRYFADDPSIVCGLASFRGQSLIAMGHEKGHDTASRIAHNFGMAHPEGYRKVHRLLDLAHRFSLPVVFFVDTPGSHAGIDAEERGQSHALATCIEKSLSVNVPILSIIIGEGGSGGAVAMATANTIYMLEHSIYSVIAPEGCAAILWRTSEKKEEASIQQKLTAQDLLGFHLIDNIIPEPLGGAHRNPKITIDVVGQWIERFLQENPTTTHRDYLTQRRQKFLAMGRP